MALLRALQSLTYGTRGGHERATAVDESVRFRPLRTHLLPDLGQVWVEDEQQADTGVRLGSPVGPSFLSG